MAYLYHHIRLDTNEVFYVGIGSGSKGKYIRANNNLSRNKSWHSIVNRVGYRVEIILDNITWELACEKEMEHIANFKRKCDGGSLINLTLGGEGFLGLEITEEHRNKMSLAKKGKPPHNKGKPMPKHQLEMLVALNKSRVHPRGFKRSDEFKRKCSIAKTGLMVGEKHFRFGKPQPDSVKEKLRIANTGQVPWNKGMKMSAEFCKNNSDGHKKNQTFQFTLDGTLVAVYESVMEAARQNNFRHGHISNVAKRRHPYRTYKGFVWMYSSELEQIKPDWYIGLNINEYISLRVG